ncbi:hypothetical protein PCCS19_18710 [Paenibacillus sp. CCS19]|uniref:hypothetical protein n=1 Tax=Paenibacillus sp. CCS19 TaxID=3158387 RepID=UPI00256DF42C|nr:hypothetical protein [Paenibacillus cellulosilyticus]GMK38817.1 hypothetical protein PCCS19_18710 [Paenibacillus cellulosilyticus]
MSAYAAFLEEKRAIDLLLNDGYRIVGISEDLDGSAVTFTRGDTVDAVEQSRLQLLTADARKYVVTLLIARMKG